MKYTDRFSRVLTRIFERLSARRSMTRNSNCTRDYVLPCVRGYLELLSILVFPVFDVYFSPFNFYNGTNASQRFSIVSSTSSNVKDILFQSYVINGYSRFTMRSRRSSSTLSTINNTVRTIFVGTLKDPEEIHAGLDRKYETR